MFTINVCFIYGKYLVVSDFYVKRQFPITVLRTVGRDFLMHTRPCISRSCFSLIAMHFVGWMNGSILLWRRYFSSLSHTNHKYTKNSFLRECLIEIWAYVLTFHSSMNLTLCFFLYNNHRYFPIIKIELFHADNCPRNSWAPKIKGSRKTAAYYWS